MESLEALGGLACEQEGTPFSATFDGDRMSGTMEVVPIDASRPVTKYHVKGNGTLKG